MPVNSYVYNVGLWIQEFTCATQKTVKTLVFQNKIVNLQQNYNNEELWKKNYRLYI